MPHSPVRALAEWEFRAPLAGLFFCQRLSRPIAFGHGFAKAAWKLSPKRLRVPLGLGRLDLADEHQLSAN
jgi:hypothetical protein